MIKKKMRRGKGISTLAKSAPQARANQVRKNPAAAKATSGPTRLPPQPITSLRSKKPRAANANSVRSNAGTKLRKRNNASKRGR